MQFNIYCLYLGRQKGLALELQLGLLHYGSSYPTDQEINVTVPKYEHAYYKFGYWENKHGACL